MEHAYDALVTAAATEKRATVLAALSNQLGAPAQDADWLATQ